jgi:hypothetical protein
MPNRLEPHQIDLNTRVKCSKEHRVFDFDGQFAILNFKTGIRYRMDEIGTRIWSQLKAKRSIREIRDFIVEEYSVESSRCERDLLGLLAELAEHDLVEFTHAADRTI